MNTSEILKELEEHLKTPYWLRDPKKSEQLMGYSLIQLTEAHSLLSEVELPVRYPSDDLEQQKRHRAFLA